MTGSAAGLADVVAVDEFLAAPTFRAMRLSGAIFCEPNVALDGVQVFPGVRIGLASYMNQGMVRSLVTIGRYCSIGRQVTIGAAKHPTSWMTTHPFPFDPKFRPPGLTFPNRPTQIGNDVWIGDKAIIMEGLSIGNGAIVGASAVVTKDVAPYTIVAGVPAKPISLRFADEVSAALDATRWWQYHPRHLRRLPFTDVEACIASIQRDREGFEVLPDCFQPCGDP